LSRFAGPESVVTCMAGFEVATHGRFWVLCRVPDYAEYWANEHGEAARRVCYSA
jgi:hypothetical protein